MINKRQVFCYVTIIVLHVNYVLYSCMKFDIQLSSLGVSTFPFPMLIHQMYKTTKLTDEMVLWRNECLKLNPGFEFKLWTDSKILMFVKSIYPHLLPMYQSYDQKIKRVDAARYLILYHYGGIYYDLDITCFRSFTPSIFSLTNIFYVSRHFEVTDINSADEDIRGSLRSGRCANAFMAAPKNHFFLHNLIQKLPSKSNESNVLNATGPIFLTSSIDTSKGIGVHEFSKHEIYSVTYLQREDIDLCKKNLESCKRNRSSIMFSFWSASWWRPDFESGD
jgi:mannosyltransferase OCH1-like enzyme